MLEPREITAALHRGGLIDITTTGRKSGRPRRIELVFFDIEGRIYISGSPGSRAWIANLNADPHMTFHLKRGLRADLAATARVITDPEERRPVMKAITTAWRSQDKFDVFFERAPLIEVVFDDSSLLGSTADAA
jgi:deazaflavin-dependent oxidoreductase (nitroreductase family)